MLSGFWGVRDLPNKRRKRQANLDSQIQCLLRQYHFTQLQSKTQEQQKTGVTKNLKTSFKCYHRNSLYKRLYNDLSFGEKDNLAFSPYLQQSRKQMMCQGRRKPFILPFTQQMFSAISFVRDIILYCSRDTVSPQSNIPFICCRVSANFKRSRIPCPIISHTKKEWR